jgi:hypothetical protein
MRKDNGRWFFLTAFLLSGAFGCGSIDPSAKKDTESDSTAEGDAGGDGGDGDSDGDSDTDGDGDADNDYYPMAVGDFWTYRETEGSVITEFTYEVTGTETMDFGRDTGERTVFVMENTFQSSSEGRTQYVEDEGDRVVRHQQDIYDAQGNFTKQRNFYPGFLRFDRTKTTVGDKWTETITRVSDPKDNSTPTEDQVTYQYEILSVDNVVTIESQSYTCIEVKRTDITDPEVKYYWFAKGIGKVQEQTGSSKIEQLIDSSYL